jgi:hypothetical protein
MIFMPRRDPSLDTLLDLHGQLLVIDDAGYWVKFVVNQVPAHKHRLRTIRAYDYKDAAALLAAFWKEVESVMQEKGVWT